MLDSRAAAGGGIARAGAAVRVHTEPLGGSPLSRAIQGGSAPVEWRVRPPTTRDGWTERVHETQGAFAGRSWLESLAGAVSPGGAGRDRLERVARAGGVLVTTGQQPGLFGGPVYTWSKALTALALADLIERELGVPAAPLFWAATDDADLLEAQTAWIAAEGGAVHLQGRATAPAGTPAAAVPQGDLRDALEALATAAGSGIDSPVMEAARQAYGDPSATIGAAYIALLEAMLQPLGIPVLDAAHPAVRSAAHPVLLHALRDAGRVADALGERDAAIRRLGFDPQVEDVAGLTPVFVYEGGAKRRIPAAEAAAVAAAAAPGALGPNVLLRPIVECTILPTVAYVAGPGELAYFAQVTALAGALGARVPAAVPRWSGTLVEPRMQRLLDRLRLQVDDLADPHAADGALARAAMPPALAGALKELRAAMEQGVTRVVHSDADAIIPPAVADGMRTRLHHQLDRFERRALAAVKRRAAGLMRDVATVRGFFFPGGKRQERALSLLPTLARYGPATLDAMLAEARIHAARLLGAAASPDSAP